MCQLSKKIDFRKCRIRTLHPMKRVGSIHQNRNAVIIALFHLSSPVSKLANLKNNQNHLTLKKKELLTLTRFSVICHQLQHLADFATGLLIYANKSNVALEELKTKTQL